MKYNQLGRRKKMTKKEALDFIRASEATGFRYGDLSYVTEKQDAIRDIELMEEESWNDGEVYEA
jgi:hypothetical protein